MSITCYFFTTRFVRLLNTHSFTVTQSFVRMLWGTVRSHSGSHGSIEGELHARFWRTSLHVWSTSYLVFLCLCHTRMVVHRNSAAVSTSLPFRTWMKLPFKLKPMTKAAPVCQALVAPLQTPSHLECGRNGLTSAEHHTRIQPLDTSRIFQRTTVNFMNTPASGNLHFSPGLICHLD